MPKKLGDDPTLTYLVNHAADYRKTGHDDVAGFLVYLGTVRRTPLTLEQVEGLIGEVVE